ncbi:MAG: CBS domain-containing protein [Chitinophagales bacterium]|nr:CBS domain-containing protein [Chitinophagales bacterium]
MIAPKLISDYIAPLQVSDTGEQALIAMHEHNVSQLPVVDGRHYAGLITMDDAIDTKRLKKPISKFLEQLRKPYVSDTAHVFDVMRAALEFNVRVVPVVDEDHNYVGVISAESCLRAFATLNSVKEHGGIIELEIPLKDYSLSEIARVVEDNDAAILNLYTNSDKETGKMQITLKLNTTELNSIVSAFERYKYEVKSVHNEEEYTEDLKERYDALMRYLNV